MELWLVFALQDCVTIEGPDTVVLKPPRSCQSSRQSDKSLPQTAQRFSFTQVELLLFFVFWVLLSSTICILVGSPLISIFGAGRCLVQMQVKRKCLTVLCEVWSEMSLTVETVLYLLMESPMLEKHSPSWVSTNLILQLEMLHTKLFVVQHCHAIRINKSSISLLKASEQQTENRISEM